MIELARLLAQGSGEAAADGLLDAGGLTIPSVGIAAILTAGWAFAIACGYALMRGKLVPRSTLDLVQKAYENEVKKVEVLLQTGKATQDVLKATAEIVRDRGDGP